MDDITQVRASIAESRAQVSETLAALEDRISGRARAVRQTVDPRELARANPLTAVALAFGAGVAFGATGADRRAAAATVRAGRRAPAAAADTVRRASSSASAAAQRRLHGDKGDHGTAHPAARKGGLARLLDQLRDAADARIASAVDEAWRSAVGLAPASGNRSGAKG